MSKLSFDVPEGRTVTQVRGADVREWAVEKNAAGGRVLNVTARAKTVTEAQKLAYQAVDQIKWPGGFCRRDIGWRAVQKSNA